MSVVSLAWDSHLVMYMDLIKLAVESAKRTTRFQALCFRAKNVQILKKTKFSLFLFITSFQLFLGGLKVASGWVEIVWHLEEASYHCGARTTGNNILGSSSYVFAAWRTSWSCS